MPARAVIIRFERECLERDKQLSGCLVSRCGSMSNDLVGSTEVVRASPS
jgi:hypothetical protein